MGTVIDALLVGYELPENIGLRSIVAYLRTKGRSAAVVPFKGGDHARVLAEAQRLRPRLVGFSLIFQHTIEEFGDLMRDLREHGLTAHFTAGGHFPSMRPMQTLELLPQLDSIVRFEGELTLADLLNRLDHPEQWDQIAGLAYRSGSGVSLNPLRPLIADLDSLPPIWRDETPRLRGGVRLASMLASRGCLFNCSFCSIRQFYGEPPGPLRRTRSPQSVVAEMQGLFAERGVRFFDFRDDDFTARRPDQRQWMDAFLCALDECGLARRIRWQISCRADDLTPEIIDGMMARGLIAVYLGVESGSETGLRALNKHTTVAQNLAAIDLIKSRNLGLGFGFMLFDPSSTMETIRENIEFLRAAGHDGYCPIGFCKMMPYAGTPVEAALRDAGRLEGTTLLPDYRFLSAEVDWYEYFVKQIFTRRNFSPDGLLRRLQDADLAVRLAAAFGAAEPAPAYRPALHELTRDGNRLAVQTLSKLHGALAAHSIDDVLTEQDTLVALAEEEWEGEMRIMLALDRLRLSNGDATPLGARSVPEVICSRFRQGPK